MLGFTGTVTSRGMAAAIDLFLCWMSELDFSKIWPIIKTEKVKRFQV